MAAVGRPPAFETPEVLQAAIDGYINGLKSQPEDKRIPTITGLVYHLGFESRQSFYDYEQKEEFTYTIKRARLWIEMNYEEKLSGNNPTGSIFALKNLGWKDRHELTGNEGEPLFATKSDAELVAMLKEISAKLDND